MFSVVKSRDVRAPFNQSLASLNDFSKIYGGGNEKCLNNGATSRQESYVSVKRQHQIFQSHK